MKVTVGAPGNLINNSISHPQVNVPKSQSVNNVLIDEDFSAIPGTAETVDSSLFLAYFYQNDLGVTENVPAQYTKINGWTGNRVYGAGNCIALLAYGGASSALINTPMGDYSGDVTISFRVKNLKKTGLTYLFVSPCYGTIGDPQAATMGEDDKYGEFVLTPGDSWIDCTVSFRNYTSANTGFIQFNSYGQILLDDIKITSIPDNFIAAPNVLPETNFTDSTFTINWEPVKAAYDYRLWLYKEVITNPDNSTVIADFENGLPGEGWDVSTTAQVVDDIGEDESTGLIMRNGDYIFSPTMGLLSDIKFWMHTVYQGEANPENDNNGKIYISVYDNGTWVDIATYQSKQFFNETTIDLESVFSYYGWEINNQYKGVGLHVSGLPEDTYVVLDNFAFESGPQSELQPAGDRDDYTSVRDTHYTATGLDATTEYYYRVNSHYLFLEGKGELIHAKGLPTPETLPATNIDSRGSYTANWKALAKAKSYTVKNYGVHQAERAEEYVVLEEDFDKIDASVTAGTDRETATSLSNDVNLQINLDEYTQLPGWTGYGVNVAQGLLGCSMKTYGNRTITTPKMWLSNADSFLLSVRAIGEPGDYLYMSTSGGDAAIPFDEDGTLDQTFIVSISNSEEQITFSSYIGYDFLIDYVKVQQHLEAGQTCYTYLGEQSTTETSADFINLAQWEDFDISVTV